MDMMLLMFSIIIMGYLVYLFYLTDRMKSTTERMLERCKDIKSNLNEIIKQLKVVKKDKNGKK